MDEDILFWIKLVSFLLTMFISFQIGRFFERARLVKSLTKEKDGIAEALDEFFSPPAAITIDDEGRRTWKASYRERPGGNDMEKKHFLA